MSGHETGPQETYAEQLAKRASEGISTGLIMALFGWLIIFSPRSKQFGEQSSGGGHH
jgi:hypothetical protein